MCTLTYINNNGCRYFTSNRDENNNRPTPVKIETILSNNKNIQFPKDPLAGGTWFAISDKPEVAVLLNGAFKKHIPEYPYKKSRGLILLELITDNDPKTAFQEISLEKIEPFTIIYAGKKELIELRWDGRIKHTHHLVPDNNYIWSSSTLYDAAAIYKRERLFEQFVNNTGVVNEKVIFDFHMQNHNDPENGFMISRVNGIQTQSITQAVLQEDYIHIFYWNLLSKPGTENYLKEAIK